MLLIILLACLARHNNTTNEGSSRPASSEKPTARSSDSFPSEFPAVYVVSQHPFVEMDDFVASSSAEYHLNVRRYAAGMKDALTAYLSDQPNIKAVFVGTRRTDPHGERLTHFDRTDSGWPDFMRVHPVIDWHYGM